MTEETEQLRELWVMRGPHYRIGFWVVWINQDVAELTPAVPLFGKQTAAVDEFLKVIGTKVKAHWRVPRHSWIAIAESVPKAHPEDLMAWNPAGKPKVEHVDLGFQFSPEMDKFVREFAGSGILPLPQAQIVFSAMQKHLLDWLINREKPVDLGPFIIHPVPLRPNWKQILRDKFPNVPAIIRGLSRAKRDQHLYDCGVAEAMIQSDMLEVNGKKPPYTIDWTLEVELKPDWIKNSRRHELNKYKHKGPGGYARSVVDTLKRAIRQNLRLYLQWMSKTGRPAGAFRDGVIAGSLLLVPYIPKGRVRPKATVVEPAPTVGDLEAKSTGAEEPLVPSNESVPAVSDLQPLPEDVRNGSINGESGGPTVGMPLLFASQEQAAGELLGDGKGV